MSASDVTAHPPSLALREQFDTAEREVPVA